MNNCQESPQEKLDNFDADSCKDILVGDLVYDDMDNASLVVKKWNWDSRVAALSNGSVKLIERAKLHKIKIR
jgi:hypothetical protein